MDFRLVGLQRLLPILFSVFSVSYSGAVFSATASGVLAVSATVAALCTITSSPLTFTAYNGSVNVTNTVSISVTCTAGTTYNVGLGTGDGTGASITDRKMTNSTNTLNYGLFKDSGYTSNWGNNTSGEVGGTGSGAHTVYGKIPASQTTAPVGTYTDSVAITVTY